MSKATTALKLVRGLKRTVETKYGLITMGGLIPNSSGSAAGTYLSLVYPTQGPGASQRVGDKITMKNFQMKWIAENNPTGNIVQQYRFILFTMKHEDQIAVSTLPTKFIPSSDLGTSTVVNSYFRMGEDQDWNVLYDKTFTVTRDTVNDGVQRRLYLKINKHQIEYSVTSTNIEHGGLYMMMFSDTSTGGPVIQATYKYEYTDP